MDLLNLIEQRLGSELGHIGRRDLGLLPLERIEEPADSLPPTGALLQSVEQVGVIEPLLLVESAGGKWTILSGRRRYLAAKQTGRNTVPAVALEVEDERLRPAVVLILDTLRADNPVADARAACSLLAEGFEEAAIRKATGLSAPAMRKLRLLGAVDPRLLARVSAGDCAPGTAMAVAKLPKEAREAVLSAPGPITAKAAKAFTQVERAHRAIELPADLFVLPEEPAAEQPAEMEMEEIDFLLPSFDLIQQRNAPPAVPLNREILFQAMVGSLIQLEELGVIAVSPFAVKTLQDVRAFLAKEKGGVQ